MSHRFIHKKKFNISCNRLTAEMQQECVTMLSSCWLLDLDCVHPIFVSFHLMILTGKTTIFTLFKRRLGNLFCFPSVERSEMP